MFLSFVGEESIMQKLDTLRLTRRTLTKAAAAGSAALIGGLAARPARAAGAPETTKAKRLRLSTAI